MKIIVLKRNDQFSDELLYVNVDRIRCWGKGAKGKTFISCGGEDDTFLVLESPDDIRSLIQYAKEE